MKRNKFLIGIVVATMLLGTTGCGKSGSQEGISTAKTQAVANDSEATISGSTSADAGESDSTDNQETENTDQGTAVSIKEIYEKIKSTYTLPDMYEADADWLMNYYGIDANMLSDYVFAEADEVHADRVIILNVADEANVSEVEEKLNAVYGQLSSPEMLDYLPDQADIITSASIKKQGNTLYLVISPDAEGIEEIIKSNLGE